MIQGILTGGGGRGGRRAGHAQSRNGCAGSWPCWDLEPGLSWKGDGQEQMQVSFAEGVFAIGLCMTVVFNLLGAGTVMLPLTDKK